VLLLELLSLLLVELCRLLVEDNSELVLLLELLSLLLVEDCSELVLLSKLDVLLA
jgi:hypothetical protein